jgi:hypothetical protein
MYGLAGMSLSEVDRSALDATLAECDQFGRMPFLNTYGFRPATSYVLRHDGRFYDPKAVVGVAHQHTPSGNPLQPSQFDATQAITRLETLGYEVLPFSGLWWANQRGGYKDERDHGFVRAPQQTRGGQRVSHHTNVANLRVGQRIIHYADSHIRTVGVVAEAPFTSVRPDERTPELCDRPGYLCPVDYHELPTPIPRDDIPDRGAEVGPFDVNGNPKFGGSVALVDCEIAADLDC